MDLDNGGRLRNVFRIDARASESFEDVFTFDTNLINKYDMPFTPFMGFNHHGQ